MTGRRRRSPSLPPVFGRSRLKLAVASALSVLVHAGAAWSVHDRPLVTRALESPDDRRLVFRIRRAEDPLAAAAAAVEGAARQEPVEQAPPELDDLSRALLDSGAQAPAAEDRTPDLAIVEALEARWALPDRGPPPVEPAVGPSPDLVRTLVGALALEVPYRAAGARQDAVPAGAAAAPDVAQEMLAAARLVPAPLPAALDLGPPEAMPAEPPDRRVAPPLVEPAPLNLVDLLLRNATRIKVPQYLDEDFDYTLWVYQPPPRRGVEPDDGRACFRVDIAARRSLGKLRTIPKDVVYLVDTSGSVTQTWVDAVVGGVSDALDSLGPEDRFNLVMFKETTLVLDPEGTQPVDATTLAAGRRFLTEARSGGYTDVNRALSRLLVRDTAVERVHYLILISDGRPTRGVRDMRELINLITRDNDLAASIYCVGVGRSQQRELLEFLAYRNRGFCVFADRSEEAGSVIRDLASRLRYPIVTNVTLNVDGLELEAVFPRQIPNIHQGQKFAVFGRFDPQRADQFSMQISGSTGQREVAFTFKRSLRQGKAGDEGIAHDWAFWKLHHLYSEQIRRGQDPRIEREIRQLEQRYKLKTVQ